MTKYEKGLKGQKEAEDFLCSKGAQILERNYRTRSGEIDLIAHIENFIVFVEVKFRKGLTHGFPSESVGFRKQQKIIKTAMHYINYKKLVNQDFRFDVVEVLLLDGKLYAKHIEDAFQV